MRTFHVGDAESVLETLEGGSVQLIVTSPPYWNIKDYGHPSQIGFGDSYEEYLSRLQRVWVECLRVLEPGCRLCINVGDQFVRASENGGVYVIMPIHAHIISRILQTPGVVHLGSIIWQKISSSKPSGGGTFMGSLYHPRDGYLSFEHEYIPLFKKTGKARAPSKEQKDLSKMTKEQRSLWFRGVWHVPPARQKEGHPAKFPLELPERLIRMFTFHGGDRP